MKGEINKPGQPYRQQDFDNLAGALETGVCERIHDSFVHGVVANSQMVGEDYPFQIVGATGLQHINIGTGIAYGPYDDNSYSADWPIKYLERQDPIQGGQTITAGERIVISSGDTGTYARSEEDKTGPWTESDDGIGGIEYTPQSPGTTLIPLPSPGSDGEYFVWLAYLLTVDTTDNTVHKYSGKRIYFNKKDGYDLVVTYGETRPEDDPRFFVIGKFTVASGQIVPASIDQSMMPYFKTRLNRVGIEVDTDKTPTTYLNGQTGVFLDDHINALGDGTVSVKNPHAMVFSNIDGVMGADKVGAGMLGNGLAGGTGTAISVHPDSTSATGTHAKVIYADSYGVGVVVDDLSIHEGATGILEVKADGIGTTMIQDGAITNSKLAVDSVGATNYQDASIGLAKLNPVDFTGSPGAFCPIGTITMYGGTIAPAGWLLCDGSLYNDSGIYAPLRSVIGTVYGVGSGQFKVPDLRMRFPMGANLPAGVGPTGGESTHVLALSEMPSHRHQGSPYTLTEGQPGSTYHLWSNSPGGGGANYTDYQGGGAAHENKPPYLTLNFIIKY